jgi:hypothetical protein
MKNLENLIFFFRKNIFTCEIVNILDLYLQFFHSSFSTDHSVQQFFQKSQPNQTHRKYIYYRMCVYHTVNILDLYEYFVCRQSHKSSEVLQVFHPQHTAALTKRSSDFPTTVFSQQLFYRP